MNNEDTAILNYFKDRKNGFYVDVGCYHPIHRNNTHLLHMQNWSGVNVDTSKFSIDLFNFMRPKDLNYNCAISDKNENIKLFYQKELSQLSTIEKSQAESVFQGEIKEKEINAFTLDEILSRDKYKDSKIDLLDIDVEGADLKVLRGLSFEKFKPELVCVEIHAKEILFLKNKLNSILSKHTKQSIKKIAEDTDRDNFMSSDESAKYGLIDQVIASRTEVK